MFNWFKTQETVNDTTDWIPDRVADIKRRIAALESRIGRNKKPYQAPEVQREATSFHKERTESIKEMDAIKAKLLGKSK